MARMSMRNSFLGVTIQRAGLRKASSIGAFIIAWLTVHHELGERPTVEQYADWWKVSRATAYREQAEFREVWPEFLTPSDVAVTVGLDPALDTVPAAFQMASPLPA